MHEPRDIHRIARGVTRRRGADDDVAALGADGARILDQGVIVACGGGNGHLQKTISGEIKRDAFPRAQPNLAHGHVDLSRIRDGPTNEGGIASATNSDGAFIAHVGGCAIACEGSLARHEVGVRNAK